MKKLALYFIYSNTLTNKVDFKICKYRTNIDKYVWEEICEEDDDT